MSNEKTSESGTDTTLMTLDQLTQTIEMMTSVVNRLKRHLQLQLSLHQGEDLPEALRRELLANERELQSMQQLASTAAPASRRASQRGVTSWCGRARSQRNSLWRVCS